MTPRERIRKALTHKEPDKIPFDLGSRSSAIEEQAYKDLLSYLNIAKPVTCFLRAHADIHEEIMKKFSIDTKWIRNVPESSWKKEGGDTLYIDKWNVPWRKRHDSYYFELDTCPLEKQKQTDILNAEWPELITSDMIQKMEKQSVSLYSETDYFLASDIIGAGIFERAWYLRGYEKFLMEIMLEKDFAHKFFRKILKHQQEAYSLLLERIGKYIECVWITDDVATQDSLMFSPEIYREMIKPYQKELIKFIQERGVEVIFHSCGAVTELIPDFIEMGAHILHPVQISARGIDTEKLKKEFGKDLVFWGGGCDIEILQNGSKQQVIDEVKKRIHDLRAEGGFVFTPTHCIQPGTPPENIIAMIETLNTDGLY